LITAYPLKPANASNSSFSDELSTSERKNPSRFANSTFFNTDQRVQEAIRNLHGVTILTVAHRLRTIMDYDKILVLGATVRMVTPCRLRMASWTR
jgi:hypothetical protein